MTFLDKLALTQQKNRSFLCIGLDIVIANTPVTLQSYDEPMLPFARAIIETTHDIVCAYKPNLAFYLAEGAAGMAALERIVRMIPPDIPIILDAKFGDIGNTAQAYARGAFEQFKADAVTVSPYIGSDSVKPFLAYPDKCVFVLARTSNAHAGEFQDLIVDDASAPASHDSFGIITHRHLYEHVALSANLWNAEGPGACGLVVGSTAPRELQQLRSLAPALPFLIPGIGAQGGDVKTAVQYGVTRYGLGPVINASRAVIYASRSATFAEDARKAALTLVEQMRLLQEAH